VGMAFVGHRAARIIPAPSGRCHSTDGVFLCAVPERLRGSAQASTSKPTSAACLLVVGRTLFILGAIGLWSCVAQLLSARGSRTPARTSRSARPVPGQRRGAGGGRRTSSRFSRAAERAGAQSLAARQLVVSVAAVTTGISCDARRRAAIMNCVGHVAPLAVSRFRRLSVSCPILTPCRVNRRRTKRRTVPHRTHNDLPTHPTRTAIAANGFRRCWRPPASAAAGSARS